VTRTRFILWLRWTARGTTGYLHLEREETCSWIITARGYRPVLKEGVAIQPIEIALPGHFVPGVGLRRHSLCVHCKRGRRRPTKGLWPQKGDFQSA